MVDFSCGKPLHWTYFDPLRKRRKLFYFVISSTLPEPVSQDSLIKASGLPLDICLRVARDLHL